MAYSEHHYDVAWCQVGDITIMYHANLTVNISVQYDERSVFGSHGQYAVWLGTAPRAYTVWANMVAANGDEIAFNVDQVIKAHQWTQESPPQCKPLKAPAGAAHNTSVRIETYDSSIEEATMTHGSSKGNAPVQITLSLSLKECKPI